MNATSEAPFFEDLEPGTVSEAAPGLTLTDGHAAVHQAIVGGRLWLALDASLSDQVIGAGARLAHPGLVCDVAIGQSTLVTQRVIGNLFYRGLIFHRAPLIGDTLRTSVEVVRLRQNTPRPGRRPTGLAALRVRTSDQEDRLVLDFWRCAMLPLRDPGLETGWEDDLTEVGASGEGPEMNAAVTGWNLDAFRERRGSVLREIASRQNWEPVGGDVVSAAPELARLSLNVASAHHDRTATAAKRRLVYGGHTIGLVGSQVLRAIPEMVTIVAWHSCDHLNPVHEGDTLWTKVEAERLEPLAAGGALIHLRARASARSEESDRSEREVLDWRLVGVLA